MHSIHLNRYGGVDIVFSKNKCIKELNNWTYANLKVSIIASQGKASGKGEAMMAILYQLIKNGYFILPRFLAKSVLPDIPFEVVHFYGENGSPQFYCPGGLGEVG